MSDAPRYTITRRGKNGGQWTADEATLKEWIANGKVQPMDEVCDTETRSKSYAKNFAFGDITATPIASTRQSSSSTGKAIGIAFIAMVAAFAFLAIIGSRQDRSKPTAKAETIDKAQSFCRLIDRYRDRYEAAHDATELERDSLELDVIAQRAKELSALLPDGMVNNWSVKIDSITPDSNGRDVYLDLDLPCNAVLKTTPSYPIKSHSPLFGVVKGLRAGDNIIVTGSLIAGGGKHGFKEMSITDSGSMDEPEYALRITKINGITEPDDLPAHPEEVALKKGEGDFLEKLLKKTKPLKNLGEISIEEFNLNSKSFRLVIWYPQTISLNAAKIVRDSVAVGTNAVRLLADMGVKPDYLSVWVHQSAGEGITGTPLVRSFGRAIYTDELDSFEWKTNES